MRDNYIWFPQIWLTHVVCLGVTVVTRYDVEKPALFRFPKDSSLRDKWVAAIPRKDWTAYEYHRVRGKHF